MPELQLNAQIYRFIQIGEVSLASLRLHCPSLFRLDAMLTV